MKLETRIEECGFEEPSDDSLEYGDVEPFEAAFMKGEEDGQTYEQGNCEIE